RPVRGTVRHAAHGAGPPRPAARHRPAHPRASTGMRIETTRSANAVRLEHAAGFHASEGHLVDQLVPLAEQALERGESLAIALQPATERALTERLDGALTPEERLLRLRPPDGGPAGA